MKKGKYDIERQHKKGKWHAIERIQYLLDENTFREIGSNVGSYRKEYDSGESLPYDGVITGYGYIKKQLVFIYSQDFTICGGTVGRKHGEKIVHILDMAIKNKCPIIGINDSGGARIQEGVNSLAGYGDIFYLNTLASGYIPQIMVIVGPCAGGAVYSPGIADFIFMVEELGYMFVTGPKVIKEVTGKHCTNDELGGAKVHAKYSGEAHFIYKTEQQCFDGVKKLLGLIPPCSGIKQIYKTNYKNKILNNFEEIVPKDQRKIYDVLKLIHELLDKYSFFEVQKEFAPNIVIGFGKLSGITIGIVANQPNYKVGSLDCDASDKAARFVRYCDAYDIPIITLVDVPGFFPSIEQEREGIIRHGAKLLYAYSEATTIKISIILRKAFGGAYLAMGSKHLRADFVYALSDVQMSVMGAEGAISIIFEKQLKNMGEEDRDEYKKKMIEKYQREIMPSKIAEKEGYIDEILLPEQIRERIFSDLVALNNKSKDKSVQKKHGNIPL